MDVRVGNSGSRTQFLKRMVQFADWSGLEVRLIYYPPYHSKYNPVERCWSALERKWNGVLLSCVRIVLACARRMTWKGKHPQIIQLPGDYPSGMKLSRKEMKPWEARLDRSLTLPKYDITIRPQSQPAAVIEFLPLASAYRLSNISRVVMLKHNLRRNLDPRSTTPLWPKVHALSPSATSMAAWRPSRRFSS